MIPTTPSVNIQLHLVGCLDDKVGIRSAFEHSYDLSSSSSLLVDSLLFDDLIGFDLI